MEKNNQRSLKIYENHVTGTLSEFHEFVLQTFIIYLNIGDFVVQHTVMTCILQAKILLCFSVLKKHTYRAMCIIT